jgi:nucleoside-diphosphate-sugar epimerase
MNFVIGSNGRIGKKLLSNFPFDQTLTINRSIYSQWLGLNAIDRVSSYFEKWEGYKAVIYIAAGILDPSESEEAHNLVNFILPRNIIKGTMKLGIKVVAFGSVMDQFISGNSKNFYYLSKKRLSNFINNLPDKSYILFIKLHTIYGGGPPNEHMFLGGLIKSLMTGKPFYTTDGNQLREYHHIDDEICAIKKLIDLDKKGEIILSHGKPILLKNLAIDIFSEFKRPELLVLGSLPQNSSENFNIVFDPLIDLIGIKFRDTCPAIIEDLKLEFENKGLLK